MANVLRKLCIKFHQNRPSFIEEITKKKHFGLFFPVHSLDTAIVCALHLSKLSSDTEHRAVSLRQLSSYVAIISLLRPVSTVAALIGIYGYWKWRESLYCLFAKWQERERSSLRVSGRERPIRAWPQAVVPRFFVDGRPVGGLWWHGLGQRPRCRSNAEFHAALARRSTAAER